MKLPPIIDRLLYALLIGLSLFALWLVVNAPDDMLIVRPVYQGF